MSSPATKSDPEGKGLQADEQGSESAPAPSSSEAEPQNDRIEGHRGVALRSIASIFGAPTKPLSRSESSPSLREELSQARRRLEEEQERRQSGQEIREEPQDRPEDSSGLFEGPAGLYQPLEGSEPGLFRSGLEPAEELIDHVWGGEVEEADRRRLQEGLFFPAESQEESDDSDTPRSVTFRRASGIFQPIDPEAFVAALKKPVGHEPDTAPALGPIDPAPSTRKPYAVLALGLILPVLVLAIGALSWDGKSEPHDRRGAQGAGAQGAALSATEPVGAGARAADFAPRAPAPGEAKAEEPVPLAVSFHPVSPEERKRVVGQLWGELLESGKVYQTASQLGELGLAGLHDYLDLLLSSHLDPPTYRGVLAVIACFEAGVERGALADLLRRASPPLVGLVQERIAALEGPELYQQICAELAREPKALTRYEYRTLEQQARRFGGAPILELLGRDPELETQLLGLLLAIEEEGADAIFAAALDKADKGRMLELLALLQSCDRPVQTERIHALLRTTSDSDLLAAACRVLGGQAQAASVEPLLGQRARRRDRFALRQIDVALESIRDADPEARGRPVEVWWAEIASLWRELDALVETALDPARSSEDRAFAVSGLARIRDPRVDHALQALTARGPAAVRLAAIRAVGARRMRGAIPELVALLEDPNVPLRWAAHAALRAITGAPLGLDRGDWEAFLKMEARR